MGVTEHAAVLPVHCSVVFIPLAEQMRGKGKLAEGTQRELEQGVEREVGRGFMATKAIRQVRALRVQKGSKFAGESSRVAAT